MILRHHPRRQVRCHDQVLFRPHHQAAARALDLTEPTIRSSFQHLAKPGIVQEVSGRQRGQVFAYQSYVRILNEGTETNQRPSAPSTAATAPTP